MLFFFFFGFFSSRISRIVHPFNKSAKVGKGQTRGAGRAREAGFVASIECVARASLSLRNLDAQNAHHHRHGADWRVNSWRTFLVVLAF